MTNIEKPKHNVEHVFLYADDALDATSLDRLLELGDQADWIRMQLTSLIAETARRHGCEADGAIELVRRELELLATAPRHEA
jgi:hypothetical protein